MLRFFAVLLTGLALIAPGAHLYELANKMLLSESEYFVVQKIYIGWWIAGLLLPLALIANLIIAYRDKNLIALGAAALILTNLVIFYFFTYPVNVSTQNWTLMPDNWETLRRQWEYSHAVNAGVTLSAFCLSILAALRKRSPA
jgi:hydrogenase-4 membrane subunit HyfE